MSLIIAPLGRLLSSVPTFASSIGCFERIDAYMTRCEEDRKSRAPIQDEEVQITDQEGGFELSTVENPHSPIIKAESVSFSITAGERPILHNVTLQIQPSTLTIAIGKIGSGKSILLLGLIGELHPTGGNLELSHSSVAYCAQTPWLINGSIKKNILGPMSDNFDETWYTTVVEACALDRDFEALPDGDGSLVGSKGLTLSGGQKQRVVSFSSPIREAVRSSC